MSWTYAITLGVVFVVCILVLQCLEPFLNQQSMLDPKQNQSEARGDFLVHVKIDEPTGQV